MTWTATVVYADPEEGQKIVTYAFDYFDEFEYELAAGPLYSTIMNMTIIFNRKG